ncbi:hypothetical protein AK812_SmicGene30880 [Symbiodinium microadriaticum]|uniref:Uncharacterized protein n=1 Tax=Symbiodinium microadriaticum TaxID=2951 RepID=A0A1Q9CYA4_SYMMI|nr:hypothetical protein AK812_SmicGene30880 [Symbiodinium microadriaticum]
MTWLVEYARPRGCGLATKRSELSFFKTGYSMWIGCVAELLASNGVQLAYAAHIADAAADMKSREAALKRQVTKVAQSGAKEDSGESTALPETVTKVAQSGAKEYSGYSTALPETVTKVAQSGAKEDSGESTAVPETAAMAKVTPFPKTGKASHWLRVRPVGVCGHLSPATDNVDCKGAGTLGALPTGKVPEEQALAACVGVRATRTTAKGEKPVLLDCMLRDFGHTTQATPDTPLYVPTGQSPTGTSVNDGKLVLRGLFLPLTTPFRDFVYKHSHFRFPAISSGRPATPIDNDFFMSTRISDFLQAPVRGLCYTDRVKGERTSKWPMTSLSSFSENDGQVVRIEVAIASLCETCTSAHATYHGKTRIPTANRCRARKAAIEGLCYTDRVKGERTSKWPMTSLSSFSENDGQEVRATPTTPNDGNPALIGKGITPSPGQDILALRVRFCSAFAPKLGFTLGGLERYREPSGFLRCTEPFNQTTLTPPGAKIRRWCAWLYKPDGTNPSKREVRGSWEPAGFLQIMQRLAEAWHQGFLSALVREFGSAQERDEDSQATWIAEAALQKLWQMLVSRLRLTHGSDKTQRRCVRREEEGTGELALLRVKQRGQTSPQPSYELRGLELRLKGPEPKRGTWQLQRKNWQPPTISRQRIDAVLWQGYDGRGADLRKGGVLALALAAPCREEITGLDHGLEASAASRYSCADAGMVRLMRQPGSERKKHPDVYVD